MSKKMALLIGINYIGTDYELSGCINDVIMMRKYLIEKRGYLSNDIIIMRDDSPNFIMPTQQNMLNELNGLITRANNNNATEIFFHYSGHGSYVRDQYKGDEKDGKDECICPVDLNFIIDDTLRNIFSKLNSKTILNCIMDSCHSGTTIDLPYLYSQSNGKVVLLENNSAKYSSLIGKNIYAMSGCKDAQTSEDAYNVYLPVSNTNPDFTITNRNLNGGALTSSLLPLLNSNFALNNCLYALHTNMKKKGYSQIPLLSTGVQMKNTTTKTSTVVNKRVYNNKTTKSSIVVNKQNKKITNNSSVVIKQVQNKNNKILIKVRNH